ncbi:RNA polymerase sigma factor [Paremcibacter congregatus]|uniref:RNA polymerase sigma factor n=1 Tax=Paremcibacter congregatus TaxID=2043170 RepID=UPI003A94B301|tara:strand:- start:944 stop:1522 length:579 start_codon:yes stop_codon:yes gene_type:complete
MMLKHRFRLIKNSDHETTQLAPAEPVSGVFHAEITRLFQDYNDPLIRYLTIRLRSRQDADEVAQEAYIRLLRRDNLDDIDCFQSFLFRTATNISIDLQRQRARQNNNHEQSKNLFQTTDDITPERDLRGRQKLTALKTAVEKLPPKCREAFMLYKFNHMEYTEIALEMGLSTSSIRKYITRALAFCVREMNK